MIFKNKELLMTACNIILRSTVWSDAKHHAKSMYNYLLNCDKNDDWYTYYHNHTLPHLDVEIENVYRSLIHSLNNFNRFKVS